MSNKNDNNKEVLITALFFYDKDFFRTKILKPLFDELKDNLQKKMSDCKHCGKKILFKSIYCNICIEKIEYNYHFGGRIC